MKLVYILLVLALAKCILLYKLYNSVPVVELKRRARAGDKRAARLYKAAAYEAALDVFLWLIGTASAAVLFIWSARTDWRLTSAVVIFFAWLTFWTASPKIGGWLGGLSSLFAKYLAWLLSVLQPVLGRIGAWFPPASRVHFHTGLYEKKDLLEFLHKQNRQLDNRIPETDLKIATGAMSFGDKTVSSVMTPRRKVKLVGAGDNVGPLLMDELHKSGFSRFPVVKDSAKVAAPQIIGTLYLNDLVGHAATGKVKDLARKGVFYINESSNLRQALGAFLKTHHHLLIVVNDFEEVVGVLSIEDVLEQIIGQPIIDEFDSYEDLRAVAEAEAKKDQAGHDEVKAEQTEETVVE
jgi:CBS domain containing-hemolysin-like protein